MKMRIEITIDNSINKFINSKKVFENTPTS